MLCTKTLRVFSGAIWGWQVWCEHDDNGDIYKQKGQFYCCSALLVSTKEQTLIMLFWVQGDGEFVGAAHRPMGPDP